MRVPSLLRDRQFAVLFVARTTSVLGSAFGPVALTFAVLDMPGATATTLTVVLTAQTVPQVALMLFGGVIADRLPRHLLMTGAESVSALAFAGLAAMFLSGTASVPFVASVVGASLALYYPALTGVVPDVVPAEHLHTANALLDPDIRRPTAPRTGGAAESRAAESRVAEGQAGERPAVVEDRDARKRPGSGGPAVTATAAP
ncbi:MFS transporter [Streptomyces arenae]|nr:MFS transporter [Streptomyces arenae]